jgi:MerR family transcriptional regulator, light-induced transcriptional regulator
MLYNPVMSNSNDTEIPPGDGLFPIRHVCAETGINPVTLRAWERRYGLIRPLRTPKGHRLYSTEDIQRIRRILSLLEEGVAVSQVGRVLLHDAPAPATNGHDHPAAIDAREPEDHPSVVPGGVPAHVRDPLSGALLEAARSLSTVQLDRVYARLVMRHGWEGVHERAFMETYETLRDEARHQPAAEARLAVFASWAAASVADQLRAALLLCEGPTCPCVILGTGHRRIGGLLLLLAAARQGLKVLPLLDVVSPAALRSMVGALGSRAVVIHTPAHSLPGGDLDRLRRLLADDGVPAYLSGNGADMLSGLETSRQLVMLPASPLQAADRLSRQLLGVTVP